MSILDRLSRVIKSNINSVLDSAEDPEKVVAQTIDEMHRAVKQGRGELVQAMANEKLIAKRQEELLRQARDWESKAMLALKSGDEELAREALRRKQKVKGEADDLERQRMEASAFVDELRARIDEAEKKVEELRNTKGSVASRVRRARQGPPGAETGKPATAMDKFDHLASRIETMEAEVEAAAVIDTKSSEVELERKFAKLEKGTDVDDELAALKKKLQ